MSLKIVNGIVALLITMFCYAAVSKGIHPDVFYNQMIQSPLLPQPWIRLFSYLVPVLELLIVGLLIFSKTRLWGLYLSAYLMFAFSFYLISLTTFFGDNVPCACGGILGKMTYRVHITFNLLFSVLTVIATVLWFRLNDTKIAKPLNEAI
jgi:hypothetical protein